MNENTYYTLPITSSETGDITDSKHKRCTQEFAYIGYTSRPDGNKSPQYKIHLTKAKALAKQIASSNMTKHQIHVTSQSIVNCVLHYILASKFFTNAMIDSLHKCLHPIIISGKGFNKNWYKALRYDTHEICSLQLTHLGVVQLLKKIDILQKFLSH